MDYGLFSAPGDTGARRVLARGFANRLSDSGRSSDGVIYGLVTWAASTLTAFSVTMPTDTPVTLDFDDLQRRNQRLGGKQGYLGRGSGNKVFEQAGLDGAGQLAAITAWVESVESEG